MKLFLGRHLYKCLGYAGIVALSLTSCGQAPSFLNHEEADGPRGTATAQGQGQAADAEGVPTSDVNGDGVIDAADVVAADGTPGGSSSATANPNTDALPGTGDGPSGSGSTTNPGNPPTTPPPATYPTVPGASTDETANIHKCMDKWKVLPWTTTVPNFRKIYASISIGGSGTTINDTARTAQPELVLIYAGVNVGGSTEWNLLNPNGYYCMVANVNVQTEFDINLHCNSRLADNSVQVNVGGSTNGSTAVVGVNVLSTVTVNNVSPAGDQCIR